MVDIAIGDDKSVTLQALNRRRGVDRLSGIRCIHTHPNGSTSLSGVDVSSLLTLRFDGMGVIGTLDGKCTGFSVGYIQVIDGGLSDKAIQVGAKYKDIENPKFVDMVWDIEKAVNLTNAVYNLEEE